MGHRPIARVPKPLALELFNVGDVRASDDSPANHRVCTSDNHAIIGLRVRRPAHDQRTTAADYHRSVPPSGANQFFGDDNTRSPCDIGGALSDELFDIEAVLFVNLCFIGSDESSLLSETSPSPTRSLMSCSCAPAGDIPINNKVTTKANRHRPGRYRVCANQLGFI